MAATAQSISRADPQFGPASEPIHISTFIENSKQQGMFDFNNCSVLQEYEQSREEQKLSMLEQCSVTDLCDSVTEICNDPKLMATLYKENEITLHHFVEESIGQASRNHAKRKKRDAPTMLQAIEDLRSRMGAEINLECWTLKYDTHVFVRAPKYTELNSLTKIKFAQVRQADPPIVSESSFQALLTITLYNRPWRGRGPVSPSSQHVLPSSQTLGDLFDAILCTSKELPQESRDSDDRIIGYNENSHFHSGSAIVIDGCVYGDGHSEPDYADKLIEHNQMAKKPVKLVKALTSIFGTPFDTLTLQINKPYWIFHQGNCEHYFVVESIRLQHSRDFSHGYPLTTKAVPAQIDQCRMCKVPAGLSVVNDIRLGESPCLLCSPCWRKMGTPDDDEGVVVVPLPRYQAGWREASP